MQKLQFCKYVLLHDPLHIRKQNLVFNWRHFILAQHPNSNAHSTKTQQNPGFAHFSIAEMTALLSFHLPLSSSWTLLYPLVNVAPFRHLWKLPASDYIQTSPLSLLGLVSQHWSSLLKLNLRHFIHGLMLAALPLASSPWWGPD